MPGAANLGCAREKACHPHGFACGVPPTAIEGAKATTIQSAANRGCFATLVANRNARFTRLIAGWDPFG